MTMRASAAGTMPVATLGPPNAPSTAPATELDCTALDTGPNDRIRAIEKSAAAQFDFSARAM